MGEIGLARGRPRSAILLGALLLSGAVALYIAWRHSKIYVSTDDAYVEGAVHTVASRIAGTVKEVAADHDAFVHRGELLVLLDPQEYRVRVENARAALELAKSTAAEQKAALAAARALERVARARLEQARLDFERAARLRKPRVVSQEDYDRARLAQEAAEAELSRARQEVGRARAALGAALAGGKAPLVALREAELRRVELELSYTRITAPADGFVTRRSVEVGNRVAPGQPLLALVPLKDLWVTANYKETQLERVRVGQPVAIEVDAYPGVEFRGHVASIMAGSGARFSLFPPENATGTFVKVVQRVPVRLLIDSCDRNPPPPLRIGMSVVPTIDTSGLDSPSRDRAKE